MMNNQWQRRTYRNRRRRGMLWGISVIVLIFGILYLADNHLIWIPFLIFPWFFVFGRRRSAAYRSMPPVQPPMQQPIYNPYASQQDESYPAYGQGYQAQQQPLHQRRDAVVYQESVQEEQQQNKTQQYEEPLTMYPQE
jgi:hypothetical protein